MKPAPMTDEQIDSIMYITKPQYIRAIIAARDAQWELLLQGQNRTQIKQPMPNLSPQEQITDPAEIRRVFEKDADRE